MSVEARLNLHVIHTVVFKMNSSKEKSVFSCGFIIDEMMIVNVSSSFA